MFRFVCLFALVGCALSGAIPEILSRQARIVGGEGTSIEDSPYQVSIQRNGQHICGGTLISPTAFVSAAQCFNDDNAGSYSVRLGSANHKRGGVVINVANIIRHPSFTAASEGNDVAVGSLATAAPLSATIKTLPLASAVPANGTSVVVTGWGYLYTASGTYPETLQKTELTVVSQAECIKNYSRFAKITDKQICAQAPFTGTCDGDAGGPLVANNQLVGIVSWSHGCALTRFPGVYTNVANVSDWIIKALSNL